MCTRRFALPPVNEAIYEPRSIPNASRTLEGTLLISPSRAEWLTMLGEMVQMVNEAVRRRAATAKDASKPLSLEYMADRLDIDDPLVGYVAVMEATGWLQGFVTCTTFTTWHRDFRWDSLNPILDLTERHDEAHGAGPSSPTTSQRAERAPPLYDADGALSTELQAELRAGDPDNEGVVWPRIAELSLLGALGCGRWLVELIIAQCEAPDSPYSYLVTQATDNSVPFYERMGFVRVGAVIVKPPEPEESGGKRKAAGPPKVGWMAAAYEEYRSAGEETLADVAARFGVPVAELLFLNAKKWPRLAADTTLRKDSKYLVPRAPDLASVAAETRAVHDEWHTVEVDTPLPKVAEQLGVDPRELVARNKGNLKGIGLSVELVAGARVLVRPSGTYFEEYCHWSFPDDDPRHGQPSYMMARRLKPRAQRGPPSPSSTAGRSEAKLVGGLDGRPAVQPSGKRAAYVQAIAQAKEERARKRQEWADSAWHVVAADTTFKREAEALGIDSRHLQELNADRLKNLQLSSLLMKDTWILTKSLDGYAVPDELKEKTDPRHLVNRVVQIDGEDDYAFWRARAPRRPRDAARADPRRDAARSRARAAALARSYARAAPPPQVRAHLPPGPAVVPRRAARAARRLRRERQVAGRPRGRGARPMDARLRGGGRRDRRGRRPLPRDGVRRDEGDEGARRAEEAGGGGGGKGGGGEGARGRRVGWRGVEGRDPESSCRSHTRPLPPAVGERRHRGVGHHRPRQRRLGGAGV